MAAIFQQLDDIELVVVVADIGLVQGAVIILVYLGRSGVGVGEQAAIAWMPGCTLSGA